MLGRDQDAIAFVQRSLAINPESEAEALELSHADGGLYRTGQIDEAKRWLAASERLWLYATVRSVYPLELSSPVYVQQIERLSAALPILQARATTR